LKKTCLTPLWRNKKMVLHSAWAVTRVTFPELDAEMRVFPQEGHLFKTKKKSSRYNRLLDKKRKSSLKNFFEEEARLGGLPALDEQKEYNRYPKCGDFYGDPRQCFPPAGATCSCPECTPEVPPTMMKAPDLLSLMDSAVVRVAKKPAGNRRRRRGRRGRRDRTMENQIWNCPACTLANDSTDVVCRVCSGPRPSTEPGCKNALTAETLKEMEDDLESIALTEFAVPVASESNFTTATSFVEVEAAPSDFTAPSVAFSLVQAPPAGRC